MIELEHSPLGGSGAHRFMNCAGSFLTQRTQIEAGEFEDVPSEFAELGTAAHELGALCLETNTEPFEHLGEEFNGLKAGWEDGIKLDAVSVYVNACNTVLDTEWGYVKDRMIEKSLKHPEIHPLLKGTVDFGLISERAIWLLDYKNGEGIGVAAPNNRQLLYYAFLMLLEYPWVKAGPRDFPMHLGIVQPNFYGIFEEPDIWSTTVGHVLDWGHNELLPRMHNLMAHRFEAQEDDFVPGPHCQFCPVLLDCPKMQRAYRTYADASEDFITMLTDKELDELYAQREYVARFKKALENTIHARLVGGKGEFENAKLVDKKTDRVWKPGAEAAIAAALGSHAYAPKKFRSPAAIEKLSTRAKELTVEYAYKPDANGSSVAPLSDPRPAIKAQSRSANTFKAFAQTPEEMGW